MKTLITALVVATTFAVSASAQDMAYVVNTDNYTIEKSLTGVAGDAVAGEAAFTGRKKGNCLACHAVDQLKDSQLFHGEVGPDLSDVGNVYSAEELRLRIVDYKVINDDVIMPAFYRATGLSNVKKNFKDQTILSAQEVEDVIAYLLTLKS